MGKDFQSYRVAAAYLRDRLYKHYGSAVVPFIGVVCGSGLSNLSEALIGRTLTVQYGEIPGFPSHCSVPGHKGEIVFGMLGESTTSVFAAVFRGRFHSYEGYDIDTVVLPTRVMRCLGVKILIVTNAAGGLNSSYHVGDIVCVMDHLAIPLLAGSKNPLVGPNDDELGPRFPATSNAYDPSLQQVVVNAAYRCSLQQYIRTNGTYCFVSGPMYESKAECRFLKMMGGDAVGMSTVPEIIAAHHAGMKIICLSLITNKVVITGDEGPAATHQEVLDAVNLRTHDVQRLVREVVNELSTSILPTLPDLHDIPLDVTISSLNRVNIESI